MALNIAKSPLIGPVLALNGWTFVMEIWLYARRIPAINRAVEQGKLQVAPGMSKEELNKAIPADARWPADNYDHLFEQPTQFYAIALALAVLGTEDALSVNLAWGYVGLRVVHSLIQSTVNRIMLRFSVFGTSSIVLAGLAARAAQIYLS